MASRRLQVVSRHERDVVNAAQLERFARAFGLPLFRWQLPLLDELPNVDRNDLYNAEPSLWGYFVEGAPINLTENALDPELNTSESRSAGLPLTNFRTGLIFSSSKGPSINRFSY